MVFFTCNSCGACLKKNQVDKHVYQCRTLTVSCMDCHKDFGIKEYGTHTKCVTEAEKYGGSDWKAPSNFNKGEKKQQAWVDLVNETLRKAGNTLNAPSRGLLQKLTQHDNVPRKKPKFMNFIRNIAKNHFDDYTIENVWNLLEAEWKGQAEAMKTTKARESEKKEEESEKENSKDNVEGERDSVEDKSTSSTTMEKPEAKLSKREKKEARQKQHKEEKKNKRGRLQGQEQQEVPSNGVEEKLSKKERKKRKRLESGMEEADKKKCKDNADCEVPDEEFETTSRDQYTEETGDCDETEITNTDFKWGATIREILLCQTDHEISMKKLRKKVLAEYYGVVGDSKGIKSKEELISKLNKKLKKQQFKVFKDSVKLVE